jgi:tetratricopeptide (TPR) repeat protein
VADVLANASRSVGYAFAGQPLTEADVRQTLARSYLALGRLENARAQAEAAQTSLQGHASRAALLRSRTLLAELMLAEGRYREALPELETIVTDQRATEGAAHPDTLHSVALMGRTLRQLDEPLRAEQLMREGLSLAVESGQADAESGLALGAELAEALLAQTRGLEAEAIARRLVATRRAQAGPTHPRNVSALQLHASALTVLLRYNEAIAARTELVRLHEEIYGPDHALTALAVQELGVAYSRAAFDRESRYALDRALGIFERTLGPDHPSTLRALRNLAVLHRQDGRFEEAEAVWTRVYDAYARTMGPGHARTLDAMRGLNGVYAEWGRLDVARRWGERLITALGEAVSKSDVSALVLDDFAVLLLEIKPPDLRNPSRALELAERAVAVDRATSADGQPHYYRLRTLAEAHRALNQKEQALATVRLALTHPQALQSWTLEAMAVELSLELGLDREIEAFLLDRLERMRRERGADDYLIGKTLGQLARVLDRQGRVQEADARFAERLAQFQKTTRDSNFEVAIAKSDLGERLLARGALAEAEPLLLEGFMAIVASPRPYPATKRTSRDRLVRLYTLWGRPDEARRWAAHPLGVMRD